jgi:hypothetical protein
MTNYRNVLERDLAHVGPAPFGFDDVARRRDRKRRNQRIAAGVVGLVVSMLVTAGLILALQSGRVPADRPIEPSPSTERVGFVGLPPEGAQPSTPPKGGLVLSSIGFGDPDGVRVDLYVYADGTMIWQKYTIHSIPVGVPEGATEFITGYLQQRLTMEGVELLRSRILSTGLFQHNLVLRARKSDHPPLTIGVRNGDRVVFVAASKAGPDFPMERPAQTRALRRVEALLADPAAWLPTTAWADREIRAYVASRYAGGFDRRVARPRELPPAAAELLWGRGDCSPFTIEEVRTISKALEDAGIPASLNIDGQLAFEIPGRGGSYLHFGPVLPDQAAFYGWGEGRFPIC